MGCPLAMGIYGIATRPLVEKLRTVAGVREVQIREEERDRDDREGEEEENEEELARTRCRIARRKLEKVLIKQEKDRIPIPSAFADDIRLKGTVQQCLRGYEMVLKEGPAYGINLCESKSKIVVKAHQEDEAKRQVIESPFRLIRVVQAARNLGSLLGNTLAKDAYAEKQAKEWAGQIETLSIRRHQRTPTVYTRSLPLA